MAQQLNLMEVLYEALRCDIGLKVQTNDVPRLRQKLYALRKQDPQLSALTLTPSPRDPKTELWIIKKGQKDGEEE